MATPTAGLDPEVVELRAGVTWDTYVRLNDEIHTNAVRLTYHQGNLEIMTVSRSHEGINRLLSSLFENLAEGLEVEFYNAGGTTHRDEESQTGFEPDTCFYVTNLDYPFRDDGPIELPRDPAPDLIIEVDISRSSLRKMSAYAAVGCREGWRHHAGRLTIFALTKSGVREVAESAVLPGVRADDLNRLLATARQMPRIKWSASIRDWARAQRRQS
jgi:Uma2 family endonuclease